ncbi:efflux RND transporter permease subunit [Granulicella sibirica]|uniref:Cobalt-zinc-cadmium resistance protein CzcA n=1 Tax=Granulicella sibirica TaxID=2479048 RepID=A0A4Q0T6Y3_9BACT|nr:efflux RND transporter permease subunit [Granulicella sibirica]RXH58782.1 Cobalt-zinc-cadmium resistance protein CzcA [Granulicella sibirica]
MSDRPQPGDKTPTESIQPGDVEKFLAQEPGLRGGDQAPDEYIRAGDREKMSGPQPPEDAGGVHFSAPFINRPVATFLLSFAVLLAGAVAYTLLPVASLPQVEFPTISVGASLPGGDPETMASAVATPLERQFSKIAGITQMTSVSSAGSANITMQFDLSREVNGAARDVQAAINAARSQLPANLPSNPSYRKINPSDAPILILALTSDTLKIPQLYDASDSILAQKIAQVNGVGQVFTGGSAKPAVRIEADPNLLTSYGIGIEALRAAIGQVNVLQPTGYLTSNDQRYSVSTSDQLFGAAAYAPLIVATNRGPVSSASASSGLPASVSSAVSSSSAQSAPGSTGSSISSGSTTSSATATSTSAATPTGGATAAVGSAASGDVRGVVRIRDVAKVSDGVEDIHTGGLINGTPAILVIVTKSPGANVIETVDNVLAMLPTLRASISPAIKLQVALDRTTTIRASVKDVTRTLIISILLVILVVFLFLREVRSTLIPSVSVPLSILGTCGVMYLLGYSLDNLSLMALTISTGFVVDDAIVVIENISRHLEMGLSPYDAAMVGSKEIGFTVLSMSTSLIAVFIPILLMGGIVGRLFREFAVTLSAAIMVSLVVSLTTTPMLSAKFLQSHAANKHGRVYYMGERILDWFTGEYERGLKWVLRHQRIVMLITIATFALNIYLFILVPKGFFPQQDTGRIGGQIRAQQDVSFDSMKEKMMELSNIVKKDRGVQNVMSFVGGGGGGGGSNTANMFMSLKPDEERQKNGDTAEAIITRLRPKINAIPGAQLLLQSQQELNIGGRQSATQYQYSLTADSVEDLNEWSPRLMAKMTTMPELKDVATDQMQNGLRAQLVIDRDTASRLGVSALAVDSTLSDAFGQAQVSTTYMPLNQYHVVMEAAQEFQQNPDALRKIFVKSTTGAMIPLSAVTHYEEQRIPLQVNHQGQSPAATLSFNLTPGYSLSQATQAIEAGRAEIQMPSTIHGGFQGTAQAFQASLSSEPVLILLALVAVYIVLGILYESFIHPLTILSTLPSAGVGALVALLLMKVDLSVIAMIGIILLIGIVKKNAIMMIDFALVAEREEGKTPEEAIYQACLMRFRPIMMTTMAALLGGLPLALGTGTGSELRRPLGITIVGGLIVSQALTLFTTPVVYLFFDRVRGRAGKLFGSRKPKTIDAHHAVPVAGD